MSILFFLKNTPNNLLLLLCCLSTALFTSCISHKELINFRTGEEVKPILGGLAKQDITNQLELKLQSNDVLGMIITTPDGGILASPYNLIAPQLAGQIYNTSSPATFIIGAEGYIDLPNIGRVKALGLTVKELRDEIVKLVSKEIINPSVNVRLMNFKVSVLGEVLHPGIFPIENERITILEALAKAGDLTSYANRSHVMIIREKNGVREFGFFDLKSLNPFMSPYYYLQQNDVIYVEPTKGKIAQIQQPVNTYLQPIVSGLSIIASITSLVIIITRN